MPSCHTSDKITTQENQLPIRQVANHCFNPIFAAYYGIQEAIVIHHFQYWIDHNQDQGKNFKDGRTWTYQTRKEIAARFPYFSDDQVRRITDSLEEKGVLIKGNYNKSAIDKTIWYAFENEEIFTIGKIAKWTGKSANRAGKSAKPIPDTKTYTKPDAKKHICPAGQDALSSKEKDELGHPVFIAPKLKGSAKKEYEELTNDQRAAYSLLMNVPPTNTQDERYNQLVAVRTAKHKGLDAVRKGIMVYKQRIERGEQVKKMGGYLKEIIEKGYEPVPAHAEENKEFWLDWKKRYPKDSFDERRDGVVFHFYPHRELAFTMSPSVFKHQLMLSINDLKTRE